MASSAGHSASPRKAAAQAQAHFSRGDFTKALSSLQQIKASSKEVDPRVLGNEALVQFTAGGCVNTDALLRQLTAAANAHHSASAGTTAAGGGELSESDDGVDLSVVTYNRAAAAFSSRQYHTARTLLEGLVLFRRVEPLSDALTLRAATLLLEVYIQSCHGLSAQDVPDVIEQARKVVAMLEEPHAFNGGEEGADDKHAAAPSKSSPLEVHRFWFALRTYRARLELLGGDARACKKEGRAALDVYAQHIKASDEAERTGGGGQQPQYRVTATTTALVLKAQMEVLRRNLRKGVRMLNSCNASNELDPIVYLNNMGCIHARMRHDRVAALHFARALECCDKQERGRRAGTFAPAAAAAAAAAKDAATAPAQVTVALPASTCEVLYNAGLALLRLGKPHAAAHCLRRAAPLYSHRPRLWLRLAEASIAAHNAPSNSSNRGAVARGEAADGVQGWSQAGIVHHTAGTGPLRRFVLEPGETAPPPAAGSPTALTLDAAVGYLYKCLALLPPAGQSGGGGAGAGGGAGGGAGASAHGGGGGDSGAAEDPHMPLRCAALCKLAYVQLELRDPLAALRSAQAVLRQLPPSAAGTAGAGGSPADPVWLLAHSYAAEALGRLGRSGEALEHVANPVLDAASALVTTRANEAAARNNFVTTALPEARQALAALCANRATLHAMKGDHAQAEDRIRPALAADPSPAVRRAAVYVRLRRGEHGAAAELLKKGS